MRTAYKQAAGLLLGGWIALCAAATPAAAQGIGVAAGIDRARPGEFGFATGSPLTIGAFQEPRRMRICVTESAPASPNIGAWVIADHTQVVVPVSNCGEVVGTRITVEPAGAFGGNRQVKGVYSIVG
jgi:hypothetical protein